MDRLTAFKDGPTGTMIDRYSYDATGNRFSAQVNGSAQTYSYPTDSHRLASVAGAACSYDAAGNTTAIDGTTRTFAYDATGRLSQATRSGTLAMEYRYNDRGEQVRRFLGTTNTYTVYDEAGHWLGDYDGNGKSLQQAIWLDDLPVGVLAGTALNYVQPDHLGAPRTVIDPVCDVAIWKWDIKGEAFGNTPPDQDADRDGTPFVFGMRFPGQRYDSATGLNQNYFRNYDTGSGRYVQSDPIGLAGGMSTYSYVASKPLLQVDLLGLDGGLVCGPADDSGSDCSRTAPGAWPERKPAPEFGMRYSSQKILSREEADAINTLNGRVSSLLCGAVGVMTARVGLWGGFGVGLVCGEALSQAKDPVHAGDVLHTKVDICPDATGNNDKTSGWVEYRK